MRLLCLTDLVPFYDMVIHRECLKWPKFFSINMQWLHRYTLFISLSCTTYRGMLFCTYTQSHYIVFCCKKFPLSFDTFIVRHIAHIYFCCLCAETHSPSLRDFKQWNREHTIAQLKLYYPVHNTRKTQRHKLNNFVAALESKVGISLA